MKKPLLSMENAANQTESDRLYAKKFEEYFGRSIGNSLDKMRNFTKYVPRQGFANFLAKHELFKMVLNTHGHIIECGVFGGGGLMSWAQLSSIYEPINHTRRIIGFDTFSGFPSLHDKDGSEQHVEYKLPGGLNANSLEDISQSIELFDINRPLGHIPRVELCVGDAIQTIPQYMDRNKSLVVALLYLDFDLYEPTKIALEHFVPRMPKGAILVFDELNYALWPGETLAVLECIGIRKLKIQRFPYTPHLSYAILD